MPCSIANILPVRVKRLHFICNQQDAMFVTDCSQRLEELARRFIEAAFALYWLEDDRSNALRIDIGLEEVVQSVERLLNGYASAAEPERVRGTRHWHRPEADLVGTTFPVSAIPMKVRPWNAPEKAMTACRPVAALAILIAFSTASAPVVTENRFFTLDRNNRVQTLRQDARSL